MQEAINRMTQEIVRIMNEKVMGVWLYGSVALDDFQLGWSDIDFVALTEEKITRSQAEALLTLRQDMQKTAPDNPYYRAFEGIIADAEEYRSRAFSRLVYWGTSGQRITDRYTPDAFMRYELARYGLPVYGGRPWPFPAPGREELIEAVRAHHRIIRTYAVQTDASLYACGWLLDIARCVYTLRHGGVIAKTQAGLWALAQRVFPDDAPLRKALAIRQAPLIYKDREDVRQWLRGLGPIVQQYADVLERELMNV